MTTPATIQHAYVNANTIIGTKVENHRGENLGEIQTLVIDKVRGDVAYAVLSFGGFLGLGDKLFAVPWSALHWNKAEDCLVLSVEKEALQSVPGFDKDQWPTEADYFFEAGRYYNSNRIEPR